MSLSVFPAQELMLCFVITPSDVTEDMLSSPECLKRLAVQVPQSSSSCQRSVQVWIWTIACVAGSHREQMGLLKRAHWTGGNLDLYKPTCLFCVKMKLPCIFFFYNVQIGFKQCPLNKHIAQKISRVCRVWWVSGSAFWKHVWMRGALQKWLFSS